MPAQPRPPLRILLTRPAAQSARFAAEIAVRFPGAEVTVSPLLAPRPVRPELPPGPHAAVIFTSETAVAAVRGVPGLPRLAWCVGPHTAQVAEAAGFQTVAGDGNADLLVAAMLQAMRAPPPAGRLLHLRGRDARGQVAARLWEAGIPCDEAVVYAQEAQPLSARAQMLLEDALPVVVPLFSPRSAAIFARAAKGARAALWVAAFSPAVAEEARAAGLRIARLAVAERPEGGAMLDAIAGLLADAAPGPA